MDSWFAHFILVNDPALELFIPFLLTASFLHNLVDGHMLQTCVLTENLAVTCLSHARGASDNYGGFVLRHKIFNRCAGRNHIGKYLGLVLIRDWEVIVDDEFLIPEYARER